LKLDHVLLAVRGLADAARDLEGRFGLGSLEGGRHPGWGTANRIVPLGETYLELVSVVDEAEAVESAFGNWVAGAADDSGRALGWAVRTSRLDDHARRLGLLVGTGSRAAPGGELRWRSAGIEQAAAEPMLPFFIEWAPGSPHPGRAPVVHPAGAAALERLLLSGDEARLAAWLGSHALPIAVRPGEAAVAGVVLSTSAGEVVLGGTG
jgi:hypothetical protein